MTGTLIAVFVKSLFFAPSYPTVCGAALGWR